MVDRRTVLAMAAALNATEPQQQNNPPAGPVRRVNVRDFGAKGDGRTDDTAAFNRATSAAEPWGTHLEAAILVPAGTYRIAGTVYLRKGQSLIGEGHSSQIDARGVTEPTFVMGASSRDRRSGQDPGGSPVRIEGLRTLGGSPSCGLIYTNVAGFSVNKLFMTACGIGIEIEGNDGILSDIYIDQCLNGIVLRNAQSIVITNSIWYSANYAVSIGSNVRALSLSNSVFSFTRYASINFEDGARDAKACVFDGCIFISNEQYDTFIGHVHSRASSTEALFSSCVFRNWPRNVINHASGTKLSLWFVGCEFDGSPAAADHQPSVSSAGISTGVAGDYRFDSCTFRRLAGPLATVGSALGRLAFKGGGFSEGRASFTATDAVTPGAIEVRNFDGLARVDARSDACIISLPNVPGADIRLRLTGRLTPTGPFVWDGIVSARDQPAGGIRELTRTPGGLRAPAMASGRRGGSDELVVRFATLRSPGDLVRATVETL
jgi:hypothetical protein